LNGVGVEEQGNTWYCSLIRTLQTRQTETLSSTTTLLSAGNIQLEVCDVTGQLVETVDQGTQLAGRHQIDLNTSNYAAGVYYYS
jgi:hypothetical protein